MNYEKNKLVVIGAGMVGSAVLNTALSLGLLSEIAVIDVNGDKAEGEALDASHTTSFAYSPNVYVHAGGYEECANAQIIAVTAGPSLKKGQHGDRNTLARTNAAVVTDIMENIVRYTREAVLIFVTNPLDVVVFHAQNHFGYPAHKVLGTGTLLDTARFRRIVARACQVDTKNVHGYVLGEHGSSAFIDWSLVNIAGIPIADAGKAFGCAETLDRDAVLKEVLNAGYRILQLKGYTSAGIAMSVARIIKAIVLNEQSILPVSSTLCGEYGIRNVALSVPCVIAGEGIARKPILPLSTEEMEKLRHSADSIASVLDDLNLRGGEPAACQRKP